MNQTHTGEPRIPELTRVGGGTCPFPLQNRPGHDSETPAQVSLSLGLAKVHSGCFTQALVLVQSLQRLPEMLPELLSLIPGPQKPEDNKRIIAEEE